MNRITLITSEGCLGCEVMRKSIKTAIEKTKANVYIDEMDINKVNRNFIKKFRIEDTPCALFFKDDKFLFKKIGSVPTVVVVQWINVHYK
jgi:thiol-disulfide isomerase/thioredoxin